MPASTSRCRRPSAPWAACTPTRPQPRDTGTGASDGRRHLPRGATPGVVGRDGARSQRLHFRRGRGGVRRRVQGDGGLRQAVRRGPRDRHPHLGSGHRRRGRRIKEALPEEEEILTPIGQARLAREGKDLSIVTYGATVWKSLEAADQLSKDDGLSVEVLDLRTLLPMDDAAIMRTVQKTNKVLIVHEDTRTGGLAGEIAARINEQAFAWLDGPIMRVTAHDVPLPYAPTLEDFVLPQTDDIVKAARWLAAY